MMLCCGGGTFVIAFRILGLFNIFRRIEPQKDLVSIYKICKIIFLTLWVLFPLEAGLYVFENLLLIGDVTHPQITFILKCLRLRGKQLNNECKF
jgi:hypothetical protein